jgi:nicotinamidase-related amidase
VDYGMLEGGLMPLDLLGLLFSSLTAAKMRGYSETIERRLRVTKALLVIDFQNDYFPGGKFPLWNTDVVLQNVERAIEKATAHGIPVVIIQHIANSEMGIAPFFNEGTTGADIHPRILAAAPNAHVVVKEFADSFEKTTLEETLTSLGVTDLLVCGMMTQNCVTHTAISKAADK